MLSAIGAFAGDYVRAMWLMLQQETPNDYVIGTGQGRTVRDFCQAAFEVVDLDYRDYVVGDERFYRTAEKFPLIADPTFARKHLDWEPEVAFGEWVKMMVEADFMALKHKAG